MLLGVINILVPVLGFTSLWKTIINIIIGFSVIMIAYRLNPQTLTMESYDDSEGKVRSSPSSDKREKDLPFVEHHNDTINQS